MSESDMKSSLNCRGPKSQQVCVIIVVHAASLPKAKCSSCPTCVSPLCTSCPLPTAVWTADCWGHSFICRNTQVWIPQTFFLFVSFFHISSVKTGLFFSPQKCVYKRTKAQNRICFCTHPCTKRQRWKNRSRKSFFQLLYPGIGGTSHSAAPYFIQKKNHTLAKSAKQSGFTDECWWKM